MTFCESGWQSEGTSVHGESPSLNPSLPAANAPAIEFYRPAPGIGKRNIATRKAARPASAERQRDRVKQQKTDVTFRINRQATSV